MLEGEHVEGHRQRIEGRGSSSRARWVTSVYDALDAWPKWLIVLIHQLDGDGDVVQGLVVPDPEDDDQRHRRMHGRDARNVDGIPGATVDEELPTLYACGVCQHCRRDVHVPQCST